MDFVSTEGDMSVTEHATLGKLYKAVGVRGVASRNDVLCVVVSSIEVTLTNTVTSQNRLGILF
jgi:hypothetical protein